MLTQPITPREYFAAHAPAEVPGWFEPVMPERPAIVCTYRDSWTEKQREQWHALEEFGPEEITDLDAEVFEAREKYEAARLELEKWRQLKREQTVAQWPWKWAALVMGARGA